MIINKLPKIYTYKLVVSDTETGEEKSFIPIEVRGIQDKRSPLISDLDYEIKRFISDISIANSKQTTKVYNK
tara:strand:+ start:247 stop:462 length:216 start_codon:yes stop_codon:yes gene_type:complete